jgi:hypothetical protein
MLVISERFSIPLVAPTFYFKEYKKVRIVSEDK